MPKSTEAWYSEIVMHIALGETEAEIGKALSVNRGVVGRYSYHVVIWLLKGDFQVPAYKVSEIYGSAKELRNEMEVIPFEGLDKENVSAVLERLRRTEPQINEKILKGFWENFIGWKTESVVSLIADGKTERETLHITGFSQSSVSLHKYMVVEWLLGNIEYSPMSVHGRTVEIRDEICKIPFSDLDQKNVQKVLKRFRVFNPHITEKTLKDFWENVLGRKVYEIAKGVSEGKSQNKIAKDIGVSFPLVLDYANCITAWLLGDLDCNTKTVKVGVVGKCEETPFSKLKGKNIEEVLARLKALGEFTMGDLALFWYYKGKKKQLIMFCPGGHGLLIYDKGRRYCQKCGFSIKHSS